MGQSCQSPNSTQLRKKKKLGVPLSLLDQVFCGQNILKESAIVVYPHEVPLTLIKFKEITFFIIEQATQA